MTLIDTLTSGHPVVAAELRPPRAELEASAGMEAWIDTYHAVRGLTRRGTPVFLTDSAVGATEEDTLRHLITNVGADVPLGRVVPFLTSKHSMDYCLAYAERARQHGFPALVVLGGDRHVGPPRCVAHAWELREAIRAREPSLKLGGWANPFADSAGQADYLLSPRASMDFYLTQIVSHHNLAPVARFVDAVRERGLQLPGIFGVFFYRSANPRTLAALARFLSVPAAGLAAEFARGTTAVDVCAATIRALKRLGLKHFYISNLPVDRASATITAILERADAAA